MYLPPFNPNFNTDQLQSGRVPASHLLDMRDILGSNPSCSNMTPFFVRFNLFAPSDLSLESLAQME